jgi:enoyl-CoA hydratase
MNYENIIVKKEKNIGWITVNRPKVLNALNRKTLDELERAFYEFENDPEIRVFIITGSGEKAFIAGADINELELLSPVEALQLMNYGQRVFGILEQITTPSIAAVNGYALGGGCELAMACDLRVASSSAKFGQPEIKLGNIPGWGGIQRLLRYIGVVKAKELVYTGKFITADEALRIGLVNKVVPAEELLKEARELAQEIADRAPVAVKIAKTIFDKGTDTNLLTGLLLEAFGVALCCSTHDQKEAVRAFLEKRKPIYSGH